MLRPEGIYLKEIFIIQWLYPIPTNLNMMNPNQARKLEQLTPEPVPAYNYTEPNSLLTQTPFLAAQQGKLLATLSL